MNSSAREMYPAFYDPENIGTLFYSDTREIAESAAQSNLTPAANQERKVVLLVIDMQVDFCHEQAALYVPGAEGDIRRLIDFIFQRSGQITDIICTLDSHLPYQIFHAAWWVDEEGNHPQPLTIITREDVDTGRWQPQVMPEFSRSYVHELEAKAKKQLTIWPYHVLVGGLGNALDPTLWSVVMWHALARKTQPTWLVKGRVPQSEHYSAIQPEIFVPDHPQGQKHMPFLETIAAADAVFVAGEAQSHCVLATLEDIVAEYQGQPEQLRKIFVLKDCMSPVLHPDVDFGALALERFEQFSRLGINFVNSTDSMPFLEESEDAVADDTEVPAPVVALERMANWQRE